MWYLYKAFAFIPVILFTIVSYLLLLQKIGVATPTVLTADH